MTTSEFAIWDGAYEKEFYILRTAEGEEVPCWPNAGFMCSTDGSGRQWEPDGIVQVRVDPGRVENFMEGKTSVTLSLAQKAVMSDIVESSLIGPSGTYMISSNLAPATEGLAKQEGWFDASAVQTGRTSSFEDGPRLQQPRPPGKMAAMDRARLALSIGLSTLAANAFVRDDPYHFTMKELDEAALDRRMESMLHIGAAPTPQVTLGYDMGKGDYSATAVIKDAIDFLQSHPPEKAPRSMKCSRKARRGAQRRWKSRW